MALKIRKNHSPPAPYDCPLSECLAIIGGTWTPNILWNLGAGPRRFSELRHDMPRISAKMLTTRLKELEEKGVIERSVMPTSPPSVEYALTRDGRELLPAIEAIAAVGRKLKRKKAKAA
ncbi:MAG: helix-turn-helix domain-containing protein [Parvularculaceae bacterium]